jgi:hypothetical protein
MNLRVLDHRQVSHRLLTWHSQSLAQDFRLFENISSEINEGDTMYTKRIKIVGRSVTALSLGMVLAVSSAGIASAHDGNNSNSNRDCASGKVSSFDYSNTGTGGYVTAVTATSVTVLLWNGTSTTYTLSPTTTYTEGSAASTVTSLVVGDRVKVQTSSSAPTAATSVNIELAELFGTVTAVGTGTITIKDPQGFSRTIAVGTSTTYTDGGAAGTLADVVVGSEILAQGTIDSNLTTLDAVTIAVNSTTAATTETISGTVTGVTSSSVTVLGKNGTSTTFTFTTATAFKEGSTTASESSLAVGQKVDVQVDAAAATTALSVKIGLTEISGKVTAVGTGTITITDHKGFSVTIAVGSSTTYSNKHAAATLTDVVVGSRIRAEGVIATGGTTLDALEVAISDAVVTPTPLTQPSGNQGHNGDHNDHGSRDGGRGSRGHGHGRR